MTVGARRFTPEVLLSAPRRSTATPSPDGTAALFTVSTYSFQSHKKSSEVRVLDITTGQTRLLSNDINVSEPTWLGADDIVLLLKGGEKGTTQLLSVRASSPLLEGWEEHKAPTGHTYYYSTVTKQSTYSRPVAPTPVAPLKTAEEYAKKSAYEAVS